MTGATLGLLNLAVGKIILILASLLILVAVPAGIVFLILFLVRSSQRKPPVASSPRDLEQELRSVAKLRDDGVITEEDFNLKKKALLGI